MPEAFSEAWAHDGLWLLALGACLAGIVRGFSGFGTALVYLPFAGQVLPPFSALASLLVKDLTVPLIHVPRALREGQPRDVLRLGLGAAFGVPLGVFALSLVHPDVFRWGVSLVSLGLLFCLIGGVRYRGKLTPRLMLGAGTAGGFLTGSVGIPGPPVLLLYMASQLSIAAIRANLMLYLIVADFFMLLVFAGSGLLSSVALAIGALMIAPYLLGNWLGALVFQPDREAFYRAVAYAIIAGAAVIGLPVWD